MATENQIASSGESVQPKIVGGVDGSPMSLEGLEWAIGEARLQGGPPSK